MIKEAEDYEKIIDTYKETLSPAPEPEEEWIWVEGYKGTGRDMKCRDYQYELGKQYDMPDDQEIKECESGFHLCLYLSDVFNYYNIGNGNRFFKVKALVRKSDKEAYYNPNIYLSSYGFYASDCTIKNKLVAKSIVFLSECTLDEVLKQTAVAELPERYKMMAIDSNIDHAVTVYRTETLIEDGYSEIFAHYVIKNGKFEDAHAVASLKDVSMDVKVLSILFNK
jgi:hypothetical protein